MLRVTAKKMSSVNSCVASLITVKVLNDSNIGYTKQWMAQPIDRIDPKKSSLPDLVRALFIVDLHLSFALSSGNHGSGKDLLIVLVLESR